MSVIKKLYKDGHLDIGQPWATDTHYEVIMGSTAYGVATDNSDMDIHAITTPPIEMVFPHLTGHIQGFDNSPPRFDNYQKHHILAYEKNYDVAIYSTVRMFGLAADNNPNILDMLWVPENCITHIDDVGHLIRRNRREFLHRGSLFRLMGYAHQQKQRMNNSNRTDLIEKYGYDTKFAYHIVRLTLQAQQILETGDMDFSEHSDFLKEVRKGAFPTANDVMEWYSAQEKNLNALYNESSLRRAPDRAKLKEILLSCLEIKYGSLDKVYSGVENDAFRKLEAIKQLVNS